MTFLKLPKRNKKPREEGISMIIDNGYGIKLLEDFLEIGADYIDMIKFGWGTSIITNNLKEKIQLCNKYNIKTYLGGTIFELAVINNKIEEFFQYAKKLNIDIVEISDGTIQIDKGKKLELIKLFSKSFITISELGSKIENSILEKKVILSAIDELEAGAWKVIFEGRESGTVGIYNADYSVKKDLIENIIKIFEGRENSIIWETPKKLQQAWFINYLGNKVNLGNVPLADIISLETLRLGLRSDTLFKYN